MSSDLQAKINGIAEKYFAAATDEKRETLKIKLFNECLRLKLNASAEADVNTLYMKQNDIDGEVLVKVFIYALDNFNPEKGHFCNLFNRVYKLRNTESKVKEIRAANSVGIKISLSRVQQKVKNDFNQLVKELGCDSKLMLEGSRLENMTYNDITTVGNYFGYDEQRINDLQLISSLCQPRCEAMSYHNSEGEEQENVHLTQQAINLEAANDSKKLMDDDIKGWLEAVLDESTKVQTGYFRCFITQALYNEKSFGQLSVLRELVDIELLKKVLAEGVEVISDKLIAEHLAVGKGAVSKQKTKFKDVAKNLAATLLN